MSDPARSLEITEATSETSQKHLIQRLVHCTKTRQDSKPSAGVSQESTA